MKVRVASPLFSYTGGRAEVEADGATLAELLLDLDRRHPGLRFRLVDEQDGIRPHVRIFVNRRPATALDRAIDPADEIQILQALSGG